MAKILVACEYSGTVREAFAKLGHDAWSCDLLPTDIPGKHIQGDVIPVLQQGWDLCIAHPPCTDLAVSGSRYFAEKIKDGRQQAAIDFFMVFAKAPIQHIAIENPIGIMSSKWRKPDQIIQPWEYGHDASKATCLWLVNLPCLVPTNVLPGGRTCRRANQTASGQNNLPPSKDRWKIRSKTYQGIADAMADQWSKYLAKGTCKCNSRKSAFTILDSTEMLF